MDVIVIAIAVLAVFALAVGYSLLKFKDRQVSRRLSKIECSCGKPTLPGYHRQDKACITSELDEVLKEKEESGHCALDEEEEHH